MPQMQDIFKDGPEKIRRSIRRTFLRARLRDEQSKLKSIQMALGRCAWELDPEYCESAPICRKLRALHDEREKLAAAAEKDISRTKEQINEAERLAEAAQAKLQDLNQRLRSMLNQRDTRKRAVIKAERQLEELRGKRERLRDDLVFCRKRRKELESEYSQPADIEKDIAELTSTEESLNSRLAETAEEIKSLQGRLRSNKRALPNLGKKVAEAMEERLDIAQQKKEASQTLSRLREELRNREKQAARDVKPLDLQLRELFTTLGGELLSHRCDEPELQPLFTSADLTVSTIENLENEIEAETKLLELLDPAAVAAFFGIIMGAGTLITALFILLITLLIVL